MYMYQEWITYENLRQFINNVLGILHIAKFSEQLQLLHLHVGRVIVPAWGNTQATHILEGQTNFSTSIHKSVVTFLVPQIMPVLLNGTG